MQKKWYRSSNDKMIGGVAGGIAEYFEIDCVIVRIIFVCALFFGAGILAYILRWIISPEEPFTIVNDESTTSTNEQQRTTSENTEANGEQTSNNRTKTSYIFGGTLVVLGVILLFSNFISFDAFWPLVFIALGVALIFKSRNN